MRVEERRELHLEHSHPLHNRRSINLFHHCNALLRSCASLCIWEIYRRKKKKISGIGIYLIKNLVSVWQQKKHLEKYLWLKSLYFISDVYSIPTSSWKTLKKDRRLNIQTCGQMIDISSVLGKMCTLPLHDTVTSAEQLTNSVNLMPTCEQPTTQSCELLHVHITVL